MQQSLLLISTLAILANASSRWQATSRSSGYTSNTNADGRIDNNNHNNEIINDSLDQEDFITILHTGKERRLSSHDLGFEETRGRRGVKKSSSSSSSSRDNIFDHNHGKSYGGYNSYSSSSRSSKKSGKGGGKGGVGKGGSGGGYYSDDTGGTTMPPTSQPTTITETTPAPTMPPPPSTFSPTLPLIQTPSPTQEPQKEIPTNPPGPTPSPRTPSPTAMEPPPRNCVVNRDGLFGAQIGVAEVIPFAYELIVFGTPTTEQQISMISAMEEGISNAIIPVLFADSCSPTSASGSSGNREVPQEDEETLTEETPERLHIHTGSGMFPVMAKSRTEERRHQSHSGGGGSFTTSASLQWDADDSDRRHIHKRDGGRHLQQTRLTGLSSRPKDQVVDDVICSGSSLGFECFPVFGQLTVYSQEKLSQFAIEAIKDTIERAISSGNLQNLDNRILGINDRDLDTDPFPESVDDTPSPTLFPTFEPFLPGPTDTDDDDGLPLPLWAIVTIGVAGLLLIVVLGLIWCNRRRNGRQYTDNLSTRTDNNIGELKRPIQNAGPNYRPPPSNINSNAFGQPGGRPAGADAVNNSVTRPQASPSNDSFGAPNPHPSTREFGPPNPHPSPIKPPTARLNAGRMNQAGGRQPRPGSTRTSNAGGISSPNRSNSNSNSTTRPSAVPTSGSFGDSSKSTAAAEARKAAYGLGPIRSPMGNKNAFKPPVSGRPNPLDAFSGVNSVSGDDRKSISGAQSVGGGDPNLPSNKKRPISSANSVSGYSATGGFSGSNHPSMSGGEIEIPTSDDSGLSSESSSGSGSGSGSDEDESEENVTLSSSDRRNANKFGDPDNAFGDADNAFGVGMIPSPPAERYSSSSSYEEEVDEEYEIEYVEDDEDEEELFLSSSADEEFWDDEVVEEVVDDPDQPILGKWTSSS